MQRPVARHAEPLYRLCIEKRRARAFEQHRDRRATAGDHAQRRRHADRLPVRRRHARLRVEDVAITLAADFKIASSSKGLMV